MLIANKSWEFVALNDRAIAFDEIVALEYASRKTNNDTRPPTAVIQLKSLLTYTGLSQLASMTRCSILGLGSHRHCLERRAEAIMAVLDATEWFTSAADDQEREKDLVLSLYPLKFVQEVQKNVGPATFFFSDSVQPYFAEALTHPGTNPKETKPMGSLLPFGLGLPEHYQEIMWDHEWKVHDSVHSWTIEGSAGCVRISDAAVISSSERQYDQAMGSTIMAPVGGEATGRQVGVQHVNLHEWMKSFDTKFANYSVCLFTSPLGSMGVLSKQIEPGVMIKDMHGICYSNNIKTDVLNLTWTLAELPSWNNNCPVRSTQG
ncbi:Heterokaryon incompatibility [Ilyonectria robusta]